MHEHSYLQKPVGEENLNWFSAISMSQIVLHNQTMSTNSTWKGARNKSRLVELLHGLFSWVCRWPINIAVARVYETYESKHEIKTYKKLVSGNQIMW